MYSKDHYEELLILLEMGQESEYGDYPSPKIKLLNMWARRVPPAEREIIFQAIEPSMWKRLDYPACIWAFEQKMQFPLAVNCPIQNLWPADISVPDNIPSLVLDRLAHFLNLTPSASTTASIITFITNIEEESNNWTQCAKNPQTLKKASDLLSAIIKKSPTIGGAILNALPHVLSKKLSQIDAQVYTEHLVVSKLKNALDNSNNIVKELAALSIVEPQSVLSNDDLLRSIKGHFRDNSAHYYKKSTEELKGKWSAKDVQKLMPMPMFHSTNKVLRDFLPCWLENAAAKKELKDLCRRKILECLDSPTKEIEKTIKWFAELKSAGITQTDYDKWLKNYSHNDFSCGLFEVAKRPKQVVAAVEKNIQAMKNVVPDQKIGSLLVYKHLIDNKPLIGEYKALNVASIEEMERELDDFGYSFKDSEKIKKLITHFHTLTGKMNIMSQITIPDKSSVKRKM